MSLHSGRNTSAREFEKCPIREIRVKQRSDIMNWKLKQKKWRNCVDKLTAAREGETRVYLSNCAEKRRVRRDCGNKI